MQEITEIKEKISIKDYLETVYGCEFRKIGHSWFCLSPLRAENNPSFCVNFEENLWYDFGTGEGGNIFTLVQKLENCSFTEAVERLKNFIGILPEVREKKVEKILKKNSLDKSQFAKSFYNSIRKTSNEILIRKYFKTFGLPFYSEIGVAEYTSTKDNLQFIVFPCPAKEEIISLECRAIKSDNGRIDHARDEYGKKIKRTIGNKYPWILYRTQEALVTESIFDCLAGEILYGNHITLIALNGVGNVKFLPEVLHKYQIMTVYLALDNDDAGSIANQKAIEIIPQEIEVYLKKDHIKAGVKDLYQLLKIKSKEVKNACGVN